MADKHIEQHCMLDRGPRVWMDRLISVNLVRAVRLIKEPQSISDLSRI